MTALDLLILLAFLTISAAGVGLILVDAVLRWRAERRAKIARKKKLARRAAAKRQAAQEAAFKEYCERCLIDRATPKILVPK